MDEMVEDRLVPDIGRRVGLQRSLERMRPESAQRHGQKTKRRRDPEEERVHSRSCCAKRKSATERHPDL